MASVSAVMSVAPFFWGTKDQLPTGCGPAAPARPVKSPSQKTPVIAVQHVGYRAVRVFRILASHPYIMCMYDVSTIALSLSLYYV